MNTIMDEKVFESKKANTD